MTTALAMSISGNQQWVTDPSLPSVELREKGARPSLIPAWPETGLDTSGSATYAMAHEAHTGFPWSRSALRRIYTGAH